MLTIIIALYLSFSVPMANNAPRQAMLAPKTEFYNLATAKANKRRK